MLFAFTWSKPRIRFGKAMAADFIGQGGTVQYTIFPGAVQPPSLEERIAAWGGGPEARRASIDRRPMGRPSTPEPPGQIATRQGRRDTVSADTLPSSGLPACGTTHAHRLFGRRAPVSVFTVTTPFGLAIADCRRCSMTDGTTAVRQPADTKSSVPEARRAPMSSHRETGRSGMTP